MPLGKHYYVYLQITAHSPNSLGDDQTEFAGEWEEDSVDNTSVGDPLSQSVNVNSSPMITQSEGFFLPPVRIDNETEFETQKFE